MDLKSITPLTVTEALGTHGAECAIWYPDGDQCAAVHGNLGTFPDPIDPLEIAQLLAAAPNLLAALKSVEWDQNDQCVSCVQMREDGHRDYCVVRKAIKKAEGGQ